MRAHFRQLQACFLVVLPALPVIKKPAGQHVLLSLVATGTACLFSVGSITSLLLPAFLKELPHDLLLPRGEHLKGVKDIPARPAFDLQQLGMRLDVLQAERATKHPQTRTINSERREESVALVQV